MGGYGIADVTHGAELTRFEQAPEETGGFDLFLSDLSENVSRAILESVNLPLHSGMKLEAVYSILGEPREKNIFGKYVHDRQTDSFEIGSEYPYHVGCTVHNEEGLIAVSVVRRDILSMIEEAEAKFIAELKAQQKEN